MTTSLGDEEPLYKAPSIEGTMVPGFYSKELNDENRRKHSLANDDILLVSYPRSGTSWTQQLVVSLLAAEKSIETKIDIEEVCVFIEMATGKLKNKTVEEILSHRPDPIGPSRFLKTHLPVHLAPWIQEDDPKDDAEDEAAVIKSTTIPKGVKMILVTRNPMDNAVSKYHFRKKHPKQPLTVPFHDFLHREYMNGKTSYGSWWDWHKGWFNTYEKYADEGEGYDGRVLFLSYEEMSSDMRAAIVKVGKFILKDPPSSEVVDMVLEATQINKMKTQFDAKEASLGEKRQLKVRKGGVGNWKETFDEEDVVAFKEYHQKKCDALGMDPKMWTFEL